jgi:hypothetical protein
MTTVTTSLGTRTSLPYTSTSLSTLASATYVVNTTAYDCTTNKPDDVIIEVDAATTNTPAGNKQLVIFISESTDGTNYRSGPTSGTTTTREPNLLQMGVLPITTASTTENTKFSVKRALGYRPNYFKIIIKNDLGVALTAGTVWTAEVQTVF